MADARFRNAQHRAVFRAAIRGRVSVAGGYRSTLGAVQPLLVDLFAGIVLAQKPTLTTLAAGVVGVVGVALLVLGSGINLEVWGVAAALAGAFSMAAGTVLARLWASPVPMPLFTAWQLVAGGLLLGVLSLIFEGRVPALSPSNVWGYSYLGLIGGGVAYTFWFRGIGKLGTSVAFLGLLSPIVATVLGYAVLGQQFGWRQGLGAVLILGSVLAGQKELLSGEQRT